MLSLLSTCSSFSFHSLSVESDSDLGVDDLVVIGTIVYFLVVGGVIEITVPSVVNWPCAWLPLSHLVVVLDWWVWSLSLSHPVHNIFIIS